MKKIKLPDPKFTEYEVTLNLEKPQVKPIYKSKNGTVVEFCFK